MKRKRQRFAGAHFATSCLLHQAPLPAAAALVKTQRQWTREAAVNAERMSVMNQSTVTIHTTGGDGVNVQMLMDCRVSTRHADRWEYWICVVINSLRDLVPCGVCQPGCWNSTHWGQLVEATAETQWRKPQRGASWLGFLCSQWAAAPPTHDGKLMKWLWQW